MSERRLERQPAIRNLAEFVEFYARRTKSVGRGVKWAQHSTDTLMHRSIAIAFTLILVCFAAAASAEQCEDRLQQDKSQQNSADEAQVRGDLKAGSECATPGDKEDSAKKTEDRAARLKSEGKVEDHTTGQAHPKE
jgi:hypothetical protein